MKNDQLSGNLSMRKRQSRGSELQSNLSLIADHNKRIRARLLKNPI